MGDQFIGEIRLVAFNFAPVGWALCNGQILSISQYSALFALLGTYYGGNGSSTFALPNLQSRVVLGMGQGQGLSPYTIGQAGGMENNTLTASSLPAHTHGVAIPGNSGSGSQPNPGGAVLAATSDPTGAQLNTYAQGSDSTLAPFNTSVAGGSVPVPNLQPYIALNYIIALNGIYPSRN